MLLDEAFRSLLRDVLASVVREVLAETPSRDHAQHGSEYLSVRDAAKFARVSPGTVRAWVNQRLLPRYGTERILRIRRADLDTLMTRGVPKARVASPEDEAREILSRSKLRRTKTEE